MRDAAQAMQPAGPRRRTAEDAAAAIDAIEHRNHNYFVDRGHTGRSFWNVNDTDRQTP